MKVEGKTSDGQLVLSGVGTLCFTKGVPLEIVLYFVKEKKLVVDWFDYIKTALLDGHNPRTIKARIESAVSDAYSVKYAEAVVERVEKVLDFLLTPSEV